MTKRLLSIAILMSGSTLVLGSPVTFKDGGNTWVYEKMTLQGWTVYYEASLAKDIDLKRKSLAHIDVALERLIGTVPRDALKYLKTIPVWVSNEPDYPLFRKGEKGVIPFHRSKDWLRENGLNPHMAPGVHVINPEAALFEHKIFEWGPMTMLHELAHGYHNFKLTLKNKDINEAYSNAMKKGLYQKVPDRKDAKKKTKAYAATNHEEYFAELTEAYFGKNDWFPTNRKELKKYDPVGYKMIEKVWGVGKK